MRDTVWMGSSIVSLLGPVEIRNLADKLDLRPTKRLGQNFVIDAGTVRRIVRVADVTPDDVVIEVGPGLGSLTLALLPEARRVIAVEIDPRARQPAARRPSPSAPLRSPTGSPSSRPTRCGCARRSSAGEPDALVANLPYNVAVPGRAAPAGGAALAAARAGDGPGGGGRPAGRRARLQGVRRAVGEGGLVRRRAPGRAGRPHGLLAGAQRRLGARGDVPGGSRPSPPPPARRCSRWSTPRSPSAARRCGRRWAAGRARRPPRRRRCVRRASTRPREESSSA